MSVAFRAALALVLLVGFYALALSIAGVLLWLPYAEFAYGHRITPKLLLLCVVGACAILWSVIPRRDAFVAPGPELVREAHPRFFAMVDDVARATGQAGPREVYLVPDVNAFVATRGGWMGMGGHRVMGVGLPLLQVLSVPELRAVLAHEFGHYHGGDTAVGPLVYQTRGAIARTVGNLGSESLLRLPFLWYGKLFLWVTHAVSRQQERVADALAAKVAGAAPLARALEKVAGAAGAFQPYFEELVSVLNGGVRPPVARGFAMFVAMPEIETGMAKLIEQQRTAAGDPLDTHPPLGERLRLLGDPVGSDPDTRPAITLLDDVLGMEGALLRAIAPEAPELRPVTWDQVGMDVNVAEWRKLSANNAAAFESITPETVPAYLREPSGLLSRMTLQGLPDEPERRLNVVRFLLMAWAGLRLVDRGWTIENHPGAPLRAVRGDERIDLHALVQAPDWAERWAALTA